MFKLNFDFIRDIVPVASIVRVPLVMEVHPSVPAKTVAEFIAYAKANPGKINIGVSRNRSFDPRGGRNVQDAGRRRSLSRALSRCTGVSRSSRWRCACIFWSAAPSIEYVRTGKLRALAVTTTTRSDVLPDVPVLSDTLTDYEASAWFGIGAPKSTPAKLIERLNKEVNISIADPKLKARFANLGGTVLGGLPADFGKLISDETKKWGKVIVAANIKP